MGGGPEPGGRVAGVHDPRILLPTKGDKIELSTDDLYQMSMDDLIALGNQIVLAPAVELESCQNKEQVICRLLQSSINPN